MRHHRDFAHKEEFAATRTAAMACLQRAKQSYLQLVKNGLTSGCRRDREWWATIKRACGDSRDSESPVLEDEHAREYISSTDKAAAFASFFSEKCSLDNDFGDELLPPVTPRTPEQISKVHFRKETVTRSLKHLDPFKATGPDGVPGIILKMCAAEIGGPLSKLFSILFRTGVQPLFWK